MDCSDKIISSIIAGFFVGIFGSMGVFFLTLLKDEYLICRDKRRVLKWLDENSDKNKKWRTTHAIASHVNLTQDRVRFICSIHNKIRNSTGELEDLWAVLKNI